jgi:putative transposase
MIAGLLIDTLKERRNEDCFDLHAWVLMPDHIHLVLQPDKSSLEEIMRRFKSLSWKRCRTEAGLVEPLWQRGFHDRGVRNERALLAAIDYVHLNPVRAELVRHPEEWPWSSFRELYLGGDEPRPASGGDESRPA